jgi:cytochrome c biogenesis protein CcmG/thiol:disulfide interchange protein DsbE
LPSTPSSADARFSRRRLFVLIALSVGIPAIALALILHAHDHRAAAAPMTEPNVPAPQKARVGSVAPDFIGTDVDGRRVTLSSLRGHPVVLTFFASWCHDCEEELPALERVQIDDPAGLHVVGVNYQDIADDSRAFVRRLGVTFPAVVEDTAANPIAARYDVHEMPDTVFIDAMGVVRERAWGPMTASELRADVNRIAQPAGQ